MKEEPSFIYSDLLGLRISSNPMNQNNQDYEYAMKHPHEGVWCKKCKATKYHPVLGCPTCKEPVDNQKEWWNRKETEEELKVGDRVLAKNTFGSIFHAHIFAIKKGIFGNKYYATWKVHDIGFDYHYEISGRLYKWNIICKN